MVSKGGRGKPSATRPAPKPRQRKRRPVRPLSRQGVYKRCRIGVLGWRPCPGEFETKGGLTRRHVRCGGDGWIRIGDKRQGGRRAPAPAGGRPRRTPRPRGTGRNRRRMAATTGAAGAAWWAADQFVGALGVTVVLVIYGLLAVLKVAAWAIVATSELATDSRARAQASA